MTERFYSRDEVIKYGQRHGYDDNVINNTILEKKNEIISDSIKKNMKGSDINNRLHNYGYGSYNPYTSIENYKQIGGNIAKDAEEAVRSVKTLGGYAWQSMLDSAVAPKGERWNRLVQRFNDTIGEDRRRRMLQGIGAGTAIGTAMSKIPIVKRISPGPIGGGFLGGIYGLLGPEGATNGLLSTYDTSVDDIREAIKNKDISNIGANVSQGIFNNPGYALVDALTFGGAKGLGKVGESLVERIPANQTVLRQIFPDKALKKFNRNATTLLNKARAMNAEKLAPVEQLNSILKLNREELAKNLMTNEGILNPSELQLSSDIKNVVKRAQEELAKAGILGADVSRNNTIAQYVMQKLGDKIPEMVHNDVYEYLNTSKMSPELGSILMSKPSLRTEFEKLIKDGTKLYDKGDISFLTMAKAPTRDEFGRIKASDINKDYNGYFGTKRVIGRATAKDLGKVLDESLRFQMNEVSKALEANNVINKLFKEGRVGTLIGDLKQEIPKGKVSFSTNKFNKALQKQIQEGKAINVEKALSEASKGALDESSYLIDKVYGKALQGMFYEGARGLPRQLLSAFKKAVLAQPHWIVLNRLGNWTNNSMAGVSIKDYADAIANRFKMPRQLAQQTSFNAYLGVTPSGVRTTTLAQTVGKPLNNINRAWKNYSVSDKSLESLFEAIGKTGANVSDVFANPFFHMESSMESIDRFANMIHQAKKINGKNWKKVIEHADNNTTLFNKLNKEVNMDLGDYVGKNYAMPGGYYNMLSETAPFYRFLTQTGRTTAHQMANSPISFQSTVVAPGKVSREDADNIQQKYKLNPEFYKGGYPYRDDEKGVTRFVSTEPLPFHTVAESFSSPTNLAGIVSPYASMLINTLKYRKGNGTIPTSKRLNELKSSKNPEDRELAKKYKGTLGEVLAYGGDQFLGSTFAPYNLVKSYLPELVGALSNNPVYRKYDASINPFVLNPLSTKRETAVEQIGRWFGLQTQPGYKTIKKKSKPGHNKYSRSMAKDIKEFENKKKGKK